MSQITQPLGMSRLAQHIASTFSRHLATVIIGLGLNIFLARVLGPERNGFYNLALLVPLLASKFFDLGIPSANAYFLGRKEIPVMVAYRTTMRLWAVLSSLGTVVAVAVVLGYGTTFFPGVPTTVLLVSLLIFPLTLGHVFLASLLRGLQDFKQYNAVLLIGPLVTLVGTAVLVWQLQWGVSGALAALAVGNLVQIGVAYAGVRTHQDKTTQMWSTTAYGRQAISYGWKVQLSTVVAFINYRVDIFLVNFFLNPASAGIYVIAVQLAERLWMLSQSVGVVVLPRLSALHNDEATRLRLTPLVTRWVFLLSILMALGLTLLGLPFIEFVYGRDYLPAYGALLWLLPGVILISGSRVLANDISARGRPELNMYTAWLVLVLNILMNVLLIPYYGINGAAMASTIAYTANSVAKIWQYAYLSGNPWWRSFRPDGDDRRVVHQGIAMIRRRKVNS